MAERIHAGRYFQDPAVARFADALGKGKVSDAQKQIQNGVDINAVGTEGFRPIFFALFPDDPAALKLLLASGADPNVHLSDGNTPLHFAVRKKTPDFAAALLAAGSDPKAKGKSGKPVIHEAIFYTNTDHLSLLAKAGADINVKWAGDTPLFRSLESMSWDMATTLLDLGADISERKPAPANPQAPRIGKIKAIS